MNTKKVQKAFHKSIKKLLSMSTQDFRNLPENSDLGYIITEGKFASSQNGNISTEELIDGFPDISIPDELISFSLSQNNSSINWLEKTLNWNQFNEKDHDSYSLCKYESFSYENHQEIQSFLSSYFEKMAYDNQCTISLNNDKTKDYSKISIKISKDYPWNKAAQTLHFSFFPIKFTILI